MTKWMNIIFLGSCFIAAILTESYSIQILDGNLIITTGLGIVVLITGYLFMDSIRKAIKKGSDGAKFYMDQLLKEEDEKWVSSYQELINLQKASYTATKKNTAALEKQFEEVLSRLDAIEDSNRQAWQKVTELQKKSLEGQKNALNLQISHMNENMKKLAGMLPETNKKTPETDATLEKDPVSEAENTANNDIKVTPLYDDPNKALTSEEIAALFASVGK